MGMGMRVLVAGIVGGIVMFLWGAVSHMMLPIGSMGFTPMPNEDAVVSTLKESITQPGLYFFPGRDMRAKMAPEQEEAWLTKLRAGPVGMVVYTPEGGEMMEPMQLVTEFAFNVLAVLLGSFIIARMAVGYGVRVLCFMLLGVIAWLSISASHWNWYNFPTDFSIGELIGEAGGWLLVGLVAGAIVKPSVKIGART